MLGGAIWTLLLLLLSESVHELPHRGYLLTDARLHVGEMQDTAAIVKAGLFLALGGIGTCLIVVRLIRIVVRLSRMEKELLKLEEELKQTREQLHNRLHS